MSKLLLYERNPGSSLYGRLHVHDTDADTYHEIPDGGEAVSNGNATAHAMPGLAMTRSEGVFVTYVRHAAFDEAGERVWMFSDDIDNDVYSYMPSADAAGRISMLRSFGPPDYPLHLIRLDDAGQVERDTLLDTDEVLWGQIFDAIISPDSDVLVTLMDSSLIAVSATTGELLWERYLGGDDVADPEEDPERETYETAYLRRLGDTLVLVRPWRQNLPGPDQYGTTIYALSFMNDWAEEPVEMWRIPAFELEVDDNSRTDGAACGPNGIVVVHDRVGTNTEGDPFRNVSAFDWDGQLMWAHYFPPGSFSSVLMRCVTVDSQAGADGLVCVGYEDLGIG